MTSYIGPDTPQHPSYSDDLDARPATHFITTQVDCLNCGKIYIPSVVCDEVNQQLGATPVLGNRFCGRKCCNEYNDLRHQAQRV